VTPAVPPISVVLCTHNPRRAYLARALAALASQSLSPLDWELIIVDNRSDVPVASLRDTSWPAHARIVREDVLGLTPARLRGIRESRGELIVFVDDDNVLDRDFLETARTVAHERAYLGAWSGQCRPEFETQPEAWTRRYWGSLVIREFERDVWSNLPRLAETMPCGAGLCVRRAVAEQYVFLHESGRRAIQLDRTGTSLVSGGDNDLAACACELGLGQGLVASLKLTHLIPAERVTRPYLLRLIEGIAFSSTILDSAWNGPAAAGGWRQAVKDWIRILKTPPPHRAVARAVVRGRNLAIRTLRGRD
jgi:glycosyltransferase involved in cell wall biosynthesis